MLTTIGNQCVNRYNIANNSTFVKLLYEKIQQIYFCKLYSYCKFAIFQIMNAAERKKFRYSEAWKNFRKRIIVKQKVDPVTGSKLTKMCNLHHCDLNEDHYDDISNEDNFVALNYETHSLVHFLFSKSKPRAWRDKIKALIKILEKMEELNV